MKCELKKVQLSEISNITKLAGFEFTKYVKYVDDGEVIAIRALNLKDGALVLDDIKRISRDVSESLERSQLRKNDIVISYTGTIGECAQITENGKYHLAPNVAKITPKDNVNPDYLFQYIRSSTFKTLMKSYCHGSTQPTIPMKEIRELPIYILSDIKTQEKIATILSSLDDKIELNNAINKNLEQQAQALFRNWFIDNPHTAKWNIGTFSDIISTTIAGDWGKDSPVSNYTEMVYCIRGADIPEVKKGNKGKMPTRFILPKNYTAKKLVHGDIVVEISGGSPTQSTGRAAAVSQSLLDRYDKGMVCTNFCKAIKPKEGYSMFAYHYWQYLYDSNVFFSYENGTTGIKNLDISGFLDTEEITIAPEEFVRQFDDVCQTIYAQIYANGLENERLANVRDTLLPKLMSGELKISEIETEQE